MKRFEVRAAWFMGVALPLAETLRRRTDFSVFAFYIDDYIFGGFLLWGAWAITRGRWYGSGLLIGGWGMACGMLYPSLFGQIARLGTKDVSGLPGGWIVFIKAVGLAIAAVGLFKSVRAYRICSMSHEENSLHGSTETR